jgi:hypothetical protein
VSDKLPVLTAKQLNRREPSIGRGNRGRRVRRSAIVSCVVGSFTELARTM